MSLLLVAFTFLVYTLIIFNGAINDNDAMFFLIIELRCKHIYTILPSVVLILILDWIIFMIFIYHATTKNTLYFIIIMSITTLLAALSPIFLPIFDVCNVL